MSDKKSPEAMLEEAWHSIAEIEAPLDVRLAMFVDRARELVPWLMGAYDNFIDRIARSDAGSGAAGVGDTMPDFVMPDQTGRLVSFRELLATGPLVISFNRGQWCEFCRMEVNALAKAHDELTNAGAQVVSIVPDKGEAASEIVDTNDLPFTVLVDVDLGFALSLGLAVWVGHEIKDLYENKMGIHLNQRQGNDAWLVPIPATIVVGTDGRIIDSYVDPDFRRRMTMDAIRSAVRSA